MADPPFMSDGNCGIRHLEATADRAWPAAETARGPDWEARFADGKHRRLNSATVWAADDLAATVAYLEAWYGERGQLPIFKLTDASAPALDAHLAARGYMPDARVAIMTTGLSGNGIPASVPGVEVAERSTTGWIDAFSSISDYGPDRRRLLENLLERIDLPTAYVLARVDGDAVSLGMAVAEGDHAGIFEMATHPGFRNRGLATSILTELLRWMRVRGVLGGYLQVLEGNEPAEHLYREAGFTTRYLYWYRVHPDWLPTSPR